jgi:coiled-coil domain-containing protein 12
MKRCVAEVVFAMLARWETTVSSDIRIIDPIYIYDLQLDQVKVAEEEVPEVDLDHVIGEDTEEVIANVAPKKPNWDLRREIAGKLAKLERKTQRAIAELALEEEKKRMAASSKAS